MKRGKGASSCRSGEFYGPPTRLLQDVRRQCPLYSRLPLLPEMSMQSRLAAPFLALGMSLALAPVVSAQSVSQDPSHAPSGAYQLETSHSQLLFSVLHIGMTDYYGRF